MNERLGRWHFWLSLVGAYATFLPMHLAGLIGNPRHYSQLDGIQNAATLLLRNALPIQRFVTYAAIVLITAQILFLFNLLQSLRRGPFAPQNVWSATTLEWAPAKSTEDEPTSAHCGPCEYHEITDGGTFQPQWASETKAE